jgi:iron(III) transport system substrate-binding protein
LHIISTVQQLGEIFCFKNKTKFITITISDFKSIRFIDYDYAKYGSSAERRRLIARWEKDVNSLPR